MKKKYRFILLFFVPSLVFSQSPETELITEHNNTVISTSGNLDYSDLKFWAAHPLKKDPSDSIPAALLNVAVNDMGVDIFFIHPTTYTTRNFTNWNASIDDQLLNDKTDQSTILYQASVFNNVGRIYAPRYRQAHLKSFYIDQNIAAAYFDTAYMDIKKAFVYYLEHENKGRPIIISAHSQGTKHAGRLLKEFFDNKPLYKKLICAYIIGMPIPENYFEMIPVCEKPDQTGCYVGWRTFKKGYEPEDVLKENYKSIVVNPLTWSTSDTLASAKLNKGGVLVNFNKIVPQVVDAKIHHNILWSCKPNIRGKIFFIKKNFHIGDINLFYVNIRENVLLRTKTYIKN
jgi:hypothetical protein